MDLILFETVFVGCRFRLRSAFDSFSVASEAFSETGRLIPGQGGDRRLWKRLGFRFWSGADRVCQYERVVNVGGGVFPVFHQEGIFRCWMRGDRSDRAICAGILFFFFFFFFLFYVKLHDLGWACFATLRLNWLDLVLLSIWNCMIWVVFVLLQCVWIGLILFFMYLIAWLLPLQTIYFGCVIYIFFSLNFLGCDLNFLVCDYLFLNWKHVLFQD